MRLSKVLDCAPVDPCPYVETGKHHFYLVMPETSEGRITALCRGCGMVRSVPANGELRSEPVLDDMTAAEIEARIYGRKRP